MDDDRLTLAAHVFFYLGLAFGLLVVLAITNVAYFLFPFALFAAPVCLLAGLALFFGFHNRDGMRDDHTVRLAWIGGGAFLLLALFVLPKELRPVGHHRHVSCLNNQRLLSMGIMMYYQDHHEQMPASLTALDSYISRRERTCPDADGAGYGFNNNLAGIDGTTFGNIASLSDTLLTADSLAPDSLLTTPSQIARTRHNKGTGFNAAYADGHAAFVQRDAKVELEVKIIDTTQTGH